MKVIFISLPYRGTSHYKLIKNVRDAEAMAMLLWKEGLATICPHLNSFMFSGVVAEEVFLNGYVEILKRCDAVYAGLGEEISYGVEQECKAARKLGIPIFTDLRGVFAWHDKENQKG